MDFNYGAKELCPLSSQTWWGWMILIDTSPADVNVLSVRLNVQSGNTLAPPLPQMSVNPLIPEITVNLLCSNVAFLPLREKKHQSPQSDYSTLIKCFVLTCGWGPSWVHGQSLCGTCDSWAWPCLWGSLGILAFLHRTSLAGFAGHPHYSSFSLVEICWDKAQEF